jgi:hypothetical protein
MYQLFQGIHKGVWALTGQLAITASVNHEAIAAALAFFGLFGSIGASIGEGIAGAMWTNMLYDRPEAYLPADQEGLAAGYMHEFEDAVGVYGHGYWGGG